MHVPPLFVLLASLFLSLAWCQSTTAQSEQTPSNTSAAAEPAQPAASYGLGVRDTPWRSPAEEQAGFHLPAGFEIKLFAAEPQIAKPLNLAFDKRGRLWVTQSSLYPYPSTTPNQEAEQTADAVVILEDTNGDGTADHKTTFADGLNIPIGVLPYGDGCVCFSIPNLWYLRDTDGDGRCDKREIVLGPFDTTRDTHGMVNALRDGNDGWIYACHGFNNQSTIAGTDGESITLISGNTFRFKADGSRVQQYTHGQVNPFGMTQDDWGYFYTADCHSKPITQLVKGACYPSFGRPHDGLGFLPPMVDHLHGSTAISGIAYISPDSPMVPLRGQMISGNVMTSRLNRNAIEYRGATAVGQELPDFLTSDDPWFRPVDIQIGPQNQIVVADFYNRIIGHYEVPLEHPGRDRTSGRIWQIRYVGDSKTASTPTSDSAQDNKIAHQQMMNLRSAEGSNRIAILAREYLNNSNPHLARLAAERLGDHGDLNDVPALLRRLQKWDRADHVGRQSVRIAVANQLRNSSDHKDGYPWLDQLTATEKDALANILPAVDTSDAAALLLDYLADAPVNKRTRTLFRQVAENATSDRLADCVQVAQRIAGEDWTLQEEWLELIWNTIESGQSIPVPELRTWSGKLAKHRWAAHSEERLLRASHPSVLWHSDRGAHWPVQPRQNASGDSVMVSSSITFGESYTGIQATEPFAAPETIEFLIAGHRGPPAKPAHRLNEIRLVDADTNEVLQQSYPPRSDIAQKVRWDTRSLDGRRVRIESLDGDSGNAYAWFAVGEFSPRWLNTFNTLETFQTDLQWLVRSASTDDQQTQVATLRAALEEPNYPPLFRLSVARAISQLQASKDPRLVLEALDALLTHSADTAASSSPWAIQWTTPATLSLILKNDSETMDKVCREIAANQSTAGQTQFALRWVQEGGSTERMLQLGDAGSLTAQVFANPEVWSALEPRLSDPQKAIAQALHSRGQASESESNLVFTQRMEAIQGLQGDPSAGGPLFKQHCAACHQLRGTGTVLGPQLDGAIVRPAARLFEDILTPNRNVDKAFLTTSFLTLDGRVLVGLIQEETENQVRLIDGAGKVQTLSKEEIEFQKPTGRSLMPANFADLLQDQAFADLLAFLKEGDTK